MSGDIFSCHNGSGGMPLALSGWKPGGYQTPYDAQDTSGVKNCVAPDVHGAALTDQVGEGIGSHKKSRRGDFPAHPGLLGFNTACLESVAGEMSVNGVYGGTFFFSLHFALVPGNSKTSSSVRI